MKGIAIFVAIVALASAAEEKQDEKKTAEKQADEIRRGLQWPLPDWSSEGDLMLYGVQFYERVGELRGVKNLEHDTDKMVLAFGRDFLRRTHKYVSATPDFKILPILCRDSRALNASKRWEIRDQPEQPIPAPLEKTPSQNDAAEPKEQNDQTHPRSMAKPTVVQPANATENVTSSGLVAIPKVITFEVQREDHYERMGANFVRLLMKQYRKEALSADETEYLAHWSADEAVHYGSMGIYCLQKEENVKAMIQQLNIFIEDKP